MSELEKAGGRASRSLISMAFEMSQENEILQARIKVLEAENKRLRVELDWVREKFLETETMLWSDRTDPSSGETGQDSAAERSRSGSCA
jgi:hypothetical protein